MPQLVRTVVWRRLDQPCAEYGALWSDEPGWQLRGTMVGALNGTPLKVRYGVLCDGHWHTLAAHLALRTGPTEQVLHLRVDRDRRWWKAGEELVTVRDCVDIDLAITPATNTLPIRRLGLEIGASARVRAAWVRFPELTIEPLEQTYTRLTDTRYGYRSDSFHAELDVDDLGLVREYSRGWVREADFNAG
ncbi:MAG TPA: putative glycolipid-binding domain-containing protein [Chloroflexota bacterium]